MNFFLLVLLPFTMNVLAEELSIDPPYLQPGTKIILTNSGSNRFSKPLEVHGICGSGKITVLWQHIGRFSEMVESSYLQEYSSNEYERVVESFKGVKVGSAVVVRPHTSKTGWYYRAEPTIVTAVGERGTILTEVSQYETLPFERYVSVVGNAEGVVIGDQVFSRNALYSVDLILEDGALLVKQKKLLGSSWLILEANSYEGPARVPSRSVLVDGKDRTAWIGFKGTVVIINSWPQRPTCLSQFLPQSF